MPPSRDELLASCPLELAGYWIGMSCQAPCTKVVYAPFRLMARKHPRVAKMRLADVLTKLKCYVCRQRPARAWVVDYPIEAPPDSGPRVAAWHVDL